MKYLALSILLLTAPLHAADEARWQQVLLFDWLYPGEPGYEALKSAALEASSDNWLVARMNRGDKLPEASARELAYQLENDQRVTPELKSKLTSIFADEPDLLKDTGNASAAGQVGVISAQFDAMSKRMDDIDAIFDKNRYGKSGFPATDINVWSGIQTYNPGGSIQNDDHSYPLGGMAITLRGTLDKATYALTLTEAYQNVNPQGAGNAWDYSSLAYTPTGNAFSFMVPLDSGGLEIHLGESVPIDFSALIMSSIAPANSNNFYINVANPYRPPTTINEANLEYPEGPTNRLGLLVKKQGSVWYWPFTNTQFVYAPDSQYFESFDPKFNILGLRLDEDFGPKGRWIDDFLLYAAGEDAIRNDDELVATSSDLTDPETSDSYALGTTLAFSSGASFKGEFAESHFERQYLASNGYTETDNDSAWIGNLTLPLGPIHLDFENGMAGPEFLTRDRYPSPDYGGELDRYQIGSTLDSTMPKSLFDYTPQAQYSGLSWASLVKDPTVLTNNTIRDVLKAEWHGSFVSLGLYDGVISQINATNPYVITSPYLEDSALNGIGWFTLFGAQYAEAPTSLPGPLLGVASNTGSSNVGMYNQYNYNQPTAGTALYNGKPVAVHWQEISQQSYDEAEFTLLLTQKGVGDPNLMQDSVKSLNYAGGTLHFDLKGVLDSLLPRDLIIVAEDRDLVANAGLPTAGGSSLFNQEYVASFLTWGLTPICNVLATAGYETWRSDHSYYPLNIQTQEYGLGADFKLDPILSGLAINLRGTLLENEDLNIGSRAFSLETINIGSTLTY